MSYNSYYKPSVYSRTYPITDYMDPTYQIRFDKIKTEYPAPKQYDEIKLNFPGRDEEVYKDQKTKPSEKQKVFQFEPGYFYNMKIIINYKNKHSGNLKTLTYNIKSTYQGVYNTGMLLFEDGTQLNVSAPLDSENVVIEIHLFEKPYKKESSREKSSGEKSKKRKRSNSGGAKKKNKTTKKQSKIPKDFCKKSLKFPNVKKIRDNTRKVVCFNPLFQKKCEKDFDKTFNEGYLEKCENKMKEMRKM